MPGWSACNRAGIQLNCHANGDGSPSDHVLTAYERALHPGFRNLNARPKITHCTLINDDLVRAHQGHWRGPGVVSPRMPTTNSDKFHFLRRAAHEAVYGPTARCSTLGSLRLPESDFNPGPFRASHGYTGNGHAHRVERRDLGREPANHRGRGATRETRLTAPTLRAREAIKGSISSGKWGGLRSFLAEGLAHGRRRKDQRHQKSSAR